MPIMIFSRVYFFLAHPLTLTKIKNRAKEGYRCCLKKQNKTVAIWDLVVWSNDECNEMNKKPFCWSSLLTSGSSMHQGKIRLLPF